MVIKVYKFKGIVGKPNFSDQFNKIIKRYVAGYGFEEPVISTTEMVIFLIYRCK